MMKKPLYLACFLGVLCAIFGGAISFVNNLTSPIIEEQAMAAETAIFKELDPDAKFSELDFSGDESGFVKKAYLGEGKDNKYYIYSMSVVGFNTGSSIDFLIGFDKDSNIVLYNVISQQETDGIGSRIADDEFSSTVIGINANDSIIPLTGATVSSNAVINGINAAKTMYANHAGVSVTTNEVAKPENKKISLEKDFTEFEAECTLQEEVENKIVFSCNAKGYGLIDPSGHNSTSGHNYSRNEAIIKIDKESKTVSEIEIITFGDTEGIGDLAVKEEYLKTLFNIDSSSEVDAVTNATWTSESVVAMIKKALSIVEQEGY